MAKSNKFFSRKIYIKSEYAQLKTSSISNLQNNYEYLGGDCIHLSVYLIVA